MFKTDFLFIHVYMLAMAQGSATFYPREPFWLLLFLNYGNPCFVIYIDMYVVQFRERYIYYVYPCIYMYMHCMHKSTNMSLVQDANKELCQGSDTNEVNPAISYTYTNRGLADCICDEILYTYIHVNVHVLYTCTYQKVSQGLQWTRKSARMLVVHSYRYYTFFLSPIT